MRGTASYPTNGNPGSATAAVQSLTIAYNAATQSYTVTSGSSSQTFGPSNIDAATSNSQITVYTRTSGSLTESLTLTKPGTSGSLTYQYVGAGYYQRTTQGSSTISATIDAFVYGIPTSDATVRRTGAARYAVDLMGVIAYTDQPVSLLGNGQVDIDFETFKILTNGSYTEVNSNRQTTGTGGWNGTATMASNTNFFNGTVLISSINAALNGLFYGPNSEELGATISGNGSGGYAIVATLLGRKSQELTTAATNTNLVTLSKSTGFLGSATGQRWSVDGSGAYQGTTYNGRTTNISWNADTQTYTVTSDTPTLNSPGALSFNFSPSTADAGQSDGKFRAFTTTSGSTTGTVKLYRPAGSNSELQLTHTGLGTLLTSNGTERTQTWFIYGLPTNAGGTYAAATGSATYSGKVYGTATGSLPSGGVGQLSGDASLSVNFTGNTLTGSMSPIATFAGGSTVNLGTYNFINGTLNSGAPNGFQASIQGPGNDTGWLGGWFFGNLYPEFGATFHVDTYATPSANEYTLDGAIVGTKN